MRLLYLLSETWPTHRSDVAILFGKYLPRSNVHSDIVSMKDCDAEEARPWGGGKAFLGCLPKGRVAKHLAKLRHNAKTMLGVETDRYDAIQVRDMPLTAIIGLIVARQKGLPFFYWMSYAIPEGAIALARSRGRRAGAMYLAPLIRGLIGKWILYSLVLPRCQHIFVQSNQMRDDVAARGVPLDRMTPVPMGVDLETAVPGRIDPVDDSTLSGRRVIVYLGTLHQSRRIEMLFDMIVRISSKIPDALLLILGDIEDSRHRDWLRQECVLRGAESLVYWRGWMPMDIAWQYLRRAELGLSPFPRSFELDSCSPTKVIEYLAFGLPVVANSQPDQERVIKESGAGFCVDWSPEAFADAVVELLQDPGRRAKMALAGTAYVAQQRSYERISSDVAERYRALELQYGKVPRYIDRTGRADGKNS